MQFTNCRLGPAGAIMMPALAARKQETLRCQVETCCADLTDLKEYYLRYKICEKCQKLRSIIRDGKRQRFCQLCGRFHNIEAFDGDKRSCRTRLQRHNARRRKQKPDSTSQGPTGSGTMDVDQPLGADDVASSKKKRVNSRVAATREMAPEVCRSASSQLPGAHTFRQPEHIFRQMQLSQPTPSWPKLEDKAELDCLGGSPCEQGADVVKASSPGTSRPSASWGQGSQQDGRGSTPGRSSPHSQVSELVSKPSMSSSSPGTHLVPEVGGWPADYTMQLRLPAISKHDWAVSAPSPSMINKPHFMTAEMASMQQPIGGVSAGQKSLDMLDMIHMPDIVEPDSIFPMRLVDMSRSCDDMHPFAPGVSDCGPTEPSWGNEIMPMGTAGNDVSGALPWSWQPQQHIPQVPHTCPVTPVMHPIPGVDIPFPVAPEEFSNPAYATLHTLGSPVDLAYDTSMCPGSTAWAARPMEHSLPSSSGDVCSELADAHNLLNASFHVNPIEVRARFSAKISHITPDDLPRNLHQQLVDLMPVTMNGVTGYVRPGCVYLTVAFGVDAADAKTLQASSILQALDHLMSLPHAEFWRLQTAVVQLYNELVLIRGGQVVRTLDLELSSAVNPCLTKVLPVAVKQGTTSILTLLGRNLDCPDCVIVARSQGQQRYLQRLEESRGAAPADGNAGDSLRVILPPDLPPGGLQIEVACKAYLTDFQVVLILEKQDVIEEIRQLEIDSTCMDETNSILLDFDRVIELLRVSAAVKAGRYVRLPYKPNYAILVKLAQRLFVIATRKGWPTVARTVLGVACMQAQSIVDVVRSMHTMSHGLSLLHLAVCSGNPKMVEFVLEWTSSAGLELSAAAPSAGGFTPLHLAALHNDDGKMAVTLTTLCVDGKDAWKVAGKLLTPFDLAQLAGTADQIQKRLIEAAREIEEMTAAHDAAVLKDDLLDGSDEEYPSTDTDCDSVNSDDPDCLNSRKEMASSGSKHSSSAPQVAEEECEACCSSLMARKNCQKELSAPRAAVFPEEEPASLKSNRRLIGADYNLLPSPKKVSHYSVSKSEAEGKKGALWRGLEKPGVQRPGASHSYGSIQTYQQLLQEADSDEEDFNSKSSGIFIYACIPTVNNLHLYGPGNPLQSLLSTI
eukprot:jgi/Botrbrau1/6264/Bobra.0129s0014.3